MKQSVDRLIHSFIPKKYVISIDQNSTTLSFKGTVSIDGHTPKETEFVTFHLDGLHILSAYINGKSASVKYKKKDQTVLLKCNDKVKGNTKVVISFEGK